MEIIQSYISMWQNFANFTGRTRRRDYWYAVLCNFIIGVIFGILINFASFFGIISGLYSLAALVPGLALSVRRLHDTGKSTVYILMTLIPIAGPIIMLVFFCQDSQPGANEFGPNPKA